uniref:C2 domain-containing protein n=1 Tax=Buteo japonicus TaxID=224669 RepID=A0A8B9Z9Y5_9AVES
MDLDKPSVWGSLKQKTRPFLQNLSVKKTKKRSSKMVERKVHSLDRRLSVSVPDMLEVEALTEEETTYSSTRVLSSCSPKSFSRSVVSLKSRSTSVRPVGEDWPWASQQATRTEVTVAHLDAQVVGSPVSQQKRKSSDNLFDLLQSARLSAYPCGEMDLDSSISSQIFDNQMVKEANDCLSDLPSPFAYLLTIHLKEGRNLVIRDRCGTSDPYVKFKLNGKTLYKSKVVYKNLNPVWDETVVLPVQTLDQKLWIKVYDRDLTSSDFMGSAFVALAELELNRTTEQVLKLEDPNSLEDDMGVIVLNLSLAVKQGEFKRNRWSSRKKRTSSKSSFMRSVRLSDSLRKNQLWNGLVTITLLEGKNIPGGGLAEIFILLKLGDQRYKSKVNTHFICKV